MGLGGGLPASSKPVPRLPASPRFPSPAAAELRGGDRVGVRSLLFAEGRGGAGSRVAAARGGVPPADLWRGGGPPAWLEEMCDSSV